MLSIHLELLDEKRKSALKKLSVFKKEAVLAGGTALMFQYAHRISFDFDLFFQRPLKDTDYQILKKLFPIKIVRENNSDIIIIITKEGIEINLVNYCYRSLFKPLPTPIFSLYALKDIMADKALTIGRKAVWRDYFDIFYFLKEKLIALEEIINLAKKKFGVDFNPSLFLDQLVYFDDLKDFNITFYKKKYLQQEIKDFLIKEVTTYAKKIINKN